MTFVFDPMDPPLELEPKHEPEDDFLVDVLDDFSTVGGVGSINKRSAMNPKTAIFDPPFPSEAEPEKATDEEPFLLDEPFPLEELVATCGFISIYDSK